MRQKSLKNLKRKKNFRETRKNFLIVCEGEKTEPQYFTAFRVSKKIFDVEGIGSNTLSLIEKAMDIRAGDMRPGTAPWPILRTFHQISTHWV